MPILTLQRRLREAGRIRIGERRTSNGKTFPTKLATFRITARDRAVVDAAAELFGGKPRPWESPDGQAQFEVVTEAAALEVVVPPTAMAFSQFFEEWTGGGCVKRCDGERELIADQPCICDPEKRACKPHTRLSVILPDLPAVGLFRLDTTGYNAAEELAGAVDLALQFAAQGTYLPAELRIEWREKRKPGEQVKKFAVPILDLKVSMRAIGQVGRALNGARLDLESGELVEIEGDGSGTALQAIEAGATDRAQHFGSVSAPAAPPAPTIEEQLATAHKQPPRAPRANAATPIPPTRLPHRGAVVDQERGGAQGEPAGDETPHSASVGTPPAADQDLQPAAEDGGAAGPESAPTAPPAAAVGEVPGPADPVGTVTADEAASIARMCNEAGVPRAAFLAGWSHEQLDRVITSAKDVPADHMGQLRSRLLDCFHGRTVVIVDADVNAARLVEVGTNQPGENVPMPADAYWKARLEYVKGIGPAKLLRMARKLAETHRVPVPSTIAEIPDNQHLRRDLNVWLLEAVDAA